jgi:hypothetical protein
MLPLLPQIALQSLVLFSGMVFWSALLSLSRFRIRTAAVQRRGDAGFKMVTSFAWPATSAHD